MLINYQRVRSNFYMQQMVAALAWSTLCCSATVAMQPTAARSDNSPRQRLAINDDWRFFKYDSQEEADDLIYDVRPDVDDERDDRPADAQPTEAGEVDSPQAALKSWILPSGNRFIADPAKRYIRPDGNPGEDFPFVRGDYDDSSWMNVELPHDWAIGGPFQSGWNSDVGGGMGRLPSPGIAWYRRKLDIPASDADRSIFLDVDGAMSYAMVWLNGRLVGGWPYGYASWRLDLTPYVIPGGENQLAIRVDNPPSSSRWYPGGGVYRNVWLVKTRRIHVGHWGTSVTLRNVSAESAAVDLQVTISNDSQTDVVIEPNAKIYTLDADGAPKGSPVAELEYDTTDIAAGDEVKVEAYAIVRNPRLWGPPPTQTPNPVMWQ